MQDYIYNNFRGVHASTHRIHSYKHTLSFIYTITAPGPINTMKYTILRYGTIHIANYNRMLNLKHHRVPVELVYGEEGPTIFSKTRS